MKMNEISLGDKIRLIPKTRHAKNRVHEHGEITIITIIRDSSFCTEIPGKDWRWIDNIDDTHFDWERVKND